MTPECVCAMGIALVWAVPLHTHTHAYTYSKAILLSLPFIFSVIPTVSVSSSNDLTVDAIIGLPLLVASRVGVRGMTWPHSQATL